MGNKELVEEVGDRDRDRGSAHTRPQVTLSFPREGWVAQSWMGSLVSFGKVCFGVPLTGPSVQSHRKLRTLAPCGQGCGVSYKRQLEGWLGG